MTGRTESSRPSRDEQAAHWHMKLRSGIDEDGQRELDRWLSEDPANRETLQAAANAWTVLGGLRNEPEMIARRSAALEAMRRANRWRWARPSGERRKWWIGTAAAAVVMAVGASLWLGEAPRLHEETPRSGLAYDTAVGERRTLALADGTRLSLDSDTHVLVDLRRDWRSLTLLAGRARFDVAKDPARPFTVTVGDRTVVATGTSFSVELLSGRARVVVIEGSVAVMTKKLADPATALRLKREAILRGRAITPDYEFVFPAIGSGAPSLLPIDAARATAWEAGQLDLVDEPLADAAERMNRYSSTPIEVRGAKARSLTINGVFNAGDSDAFAATVADAYGLSRTRAGATIILQDPPGRGPSGPK